MDWKQTSYIGMDSAETIMEDNRNCLTTEPLNDCKFKEARFVTVSLFDWYNYPTADMLLMRDVIIQWTNEQIHTFLHVIPTFSYHCVVIVADRPGREAQSAS